ncbi:MAG: cobalt-precorrin 5A hydrolase [Actinobacteria bacterium]|nr:cobalt-precorrin 5A hydrolase [Actinomycetota bacterium]
MKTAVLAVTENGTKIAKLIKDHLEDADVEIFAPSKEERKKSWLLNLVGRVFAKYDALVFISAVGIAVRAIAPHLREKTLDPAVVVVDDSGAFSISLVSGHVGGANDLARKVSDAIGAMPVITTATDIFGKPALDLFMTELGLKTGDMKRLKRISSGILRGESACIFADISLGRWGDRVKAAYSVRPLKQLKNYGKVYDHIIAVVSDEMPDTRPGTLILRTRRVFAGVGCRKDVAFEEVRDTIKGALASKGLHTHNLRGLASIDLKSGERVLYETADHFEVDVTLFPPEELDRVAPNRSDFVKEKVGAGGVCEPAAILASKGGRLILPRTVYGKVTIALAEEE